MNKLSIYFQKQIIDFQSWSSFAPSSSFTSCTGFGSGGHTGVISRFCKKRACFSKEVARFNVRPFTQILYPKLLQILAKAGLTFSKWAITICLWVSPSISPSKPVNSIGPNVNLCCTWWPIAYVNWLGFVRSQLGSAYGSGVLRNFGSSS